DTGPGVPPEILDRVFEPFFSTKAEHGTGLGLAISFGLVRGMGGRMWMQNVEGGGARLSFELPVDAGSPDAAARAAGRPAGQRLEQRIVFTTGDSISTQTRDALERAARPVLRKPFSLDELREMLERVTAG